MKQSSQLFLNILKAAIVLFLLGWMLFNAKLGGIYIPISHLDGNFQTAHGLYSLNAGKIPSKDFFLFLGIGPTFLIYPFFKVLGGHFAASVVASQFVVFLLTWLIIALIWHLFSSQKSALTSLAAGGILFLFFYMTNHVIMSNVSAPDMLGADPGPYIWQINQFFTPGPSLRATRAVLPYLVVVLYYFFIQKIPNQYIKYISCGSLSGIALLWSNDYAIITCGLFIIFISGYAYCKKEFSIINIGLLLLSTVATWIILLLLITQGSIMNHLSFNFKDVLQTQWWYVNPYSDTQRILHFTDIWKLFYLYCVPSYMALIALVWIFFKKTKIEYALILWLGLTLFFGGILPSIGGHVTIFYFGAFILWGLVVWTCLLSQFLWQQFLKRKNTDIAFNKILLSTLSVLLCAILFVGKYNAYTNISASLKNNPQYFHVPELGGYLELEWKYYVQLAKENKDLKVIEEYWGLWSAINRSESLWPVDSVIHALGNTRTIAQNSLADADIIVSTNVNNPNAFSPAWQAWSYGENFWFYEEILKNRTLVAASPTTLVWAKLEQPRTWTETSCQIDSHNQTPVVEVSEPGHYIIETEYELHGSGRALLLFKTNVQNATQGYISANPKGSKVVFPTIFFQAGSTPVETSVLGKQIKDLELKSCKAYAIDFPYINDQGMLNISISQ